MPPIQTIQRRRKSVASTKQITHAMQLVAASKMRRAQESAVRSRTYSQAAKEILEALALLVDPNDHVLFSRRDVKSRLLVVFTSDRGLAGAYNANIFRCLISEIQANNNRHVATRLVVVGQKGGQFVASLKDVTVLGVYPDWPTAPTSIDLRPIAATAYELFAAGKADQVDVIYTACQSAMRQTVDIITLLPIDAQKLIGAPSALPTMSAAAFEPSVEAVLEAMVPRLLDAQIYQANLEAIASEHAMRMSAMMNASDNAEDLMADLALAYNSARQSAITRELSEITSGGAAPMN